MTKVRAAAATGDFGALHEMAAVIVFGDASGGERGGETRPAAAGIELVRRCEQRFAAADATVGAIIVTIPVFTSEGAFGTFFAGYGILDFTQLCAPFGLGLADGGLGVLVSERHRVHYNRVDAN